MRIKVFTAPTITEAMAQLRAELGPDAVIVSTEQRRDGARVLAAMEAADPPPAATEERDDVQARHERTLDFHGVPDDLARRIAGGATIADAVGGLAQGLRAVFRFANLGGPVPRRPLLLAGPPGAGKTLTVAKLAARAAMSGMTTRVMTTDVKRAGGVEQLAAFTRILGIDLEVAEGPSDLREALQRRSEAMRPALTIIDTAGANPLSPEDLGLTAELVAASGAEAALVLAAGADCGEAVDAAAAFAAIGCTRLVATRIDAARRLGGVVAAADAGRLAFAEASATPLVAQGLTPLDPTALARLLCRAASTTPARMESVT